MPDSVETRLRSLSVETLIPTPPPGDIRRRGDRLRRRRRTAGIAAGALAALLTVGSVVNLADLGVRPIEQPAHDTTAVGDGDVLSTGDLPVRARLSGWEETALDGPTLACLPSRVVENLDAGVLGVRRFGAHLADSTSSASYAAEVRETVLEFGTDQDATLAHQSLASWISDCNDPDLVGTQRDEQHPVSTAGGVGFWELFLRDASDVCEECDAVRFDRQAVLRIENRLVLLSLSEIGGPLEPEGLHRAMRQLTAAAIVKAAHE